MEPEKQEAPEGTVAGVMPLPDESNVTGGRSVSKPIDHHLRSVLSLIESHKFYPELARGRRVEGVVMVSFTLHRDGHISELLVDGAHSLLREAAQQAVYAAAPLPEAPSAETFPLTLRFEMVYRVR